MRSARRGTVLVVFWFLAWGEVSLANLLTGIAVAATLLAVFPPRRPASAPVGFSASGAAKLVLYVLGQLVPSNLLVAREVVARRSRIRSGVVTYELQDPSDQALNLMAHVIALSPGAMTVEADSAAGTLTVHFLLLDDERALASLQRIDDLVTGALGGRATARSRSDTTSET